MHHYAPVRYKDALWESIPFPPFLEEKSASFIKLDQITIVLVALAYMIGHYNILNSQFFKLLEFLDLSVPV